MDAKNGKQVEDGACKRNLAEEATTFDHQEGRDYVKYAEGKYGQEREYSCYDGSKLYLGGAAYVQALGRRAVADGFAYCAAGREIPTNGGYEAQYAAEYADIYCAGAKVGYSMYADPEQGWRSAQDYFDALESKYGYTGRSVLGAAEGSGV